TEKQLQIQAVLPTTLIPIRIDLDIPSFRPDAALPTPNNARDFGIDENLPAYKHPDPTPAYRLKDSFLWNLHEALMTPDQFAKTFVDELDFPVDRKPALVMQIAGQIRTQLEDYAGVALHPLFQPSVVPVAEPQTNGTLRPPHSHEGTNAPNTPLPNGTSSLALTPLAQSGVSAPSSPPAVTVTAQPLTSNPVLNPSDAYRCVLSLSINLLNRLYTDKFEWSLLHPPGFPEIFAKQTCADLGLSGEWVPALTHAVYEAVLRLKKECVENGGILAGVVGSGVDNWGGVENECAEVSLNTNDAEGEEDMGVGGIAAGAGWRYDPEELGNDWAPKVEELSKEEIEKREGDRERQIRRIRRETARFSSTAVLQPQSSNLGGGGNNGDYFANGLGGTGAGGEEERMGRGERSKKKRRFRSLTPVGGRETPELGFGGQDSRLTDWEKQTWRCAHCRVWGGAVWGVKEGPDGLRTLCNNCGLLYERDKTLPPWSKDLFAMERPFGTR
ncbi:hypothetical protein LTR28_007167, partial [Elasticomyces elasticus]